MVDVDLRFDRYKFPFLKHTQLKNDISHSKRNFEGRGSKDILLVLQVQRNKLTFASRIMNIFDQSNGGF